MEFDSPKAVFAWYYIFSSPLFDKVLFFPKKEFSSERSTGMLERFPDEISSEDFESLSEREVLDYLLGLEFKEFSQDFLVHIIMPTGSSLVSDSDMSEGETPPYPWVEVGDRQYDSSTGTYGYIPNTDGLSSDDFITIKSANKQVFAVDAHPDEVVSMCAESVKFFVLNAPIRSSSEKEALKTFKVVKGYLDTYVASAGFVMPALPGAYEALDVESLFKDRVSRFFAAKEVSNGVSR